MTKFQKKATRSYKKQMLPEAVPFGVTCADFSDSLR